MAGTTDFHPGYHGTPCAFDDAADIQSAWQLIQFGYPRADLYRLGREDPAYKDAKERADSVINDLSRRQQGIPEHFDRTCPNCKHIWAERIV